MQSISFPDRVEGLKSAATSRSLDNRDQCKAKFYLLYFTVTAVSEEIDLPSRSARWFCEFSSL